MRPLPTQLFVAGSVSSADAGLLILSGVSKTYPRAGRTPLTALADVSFTLPARAVGVLLGPSGCGKSTLLRMVAGLDHPSAGEILLDGVRVEDTGRDRGMVFQSYTSFPWLTVQQNVEYGLRLHGETLALKEGTADYFIERVGLARFRDAYPDQLSGGMRQRVALARALATYPRLLLMDEPFGALDAETRWQMQELLLEVATRERMTVLIVTHDIDEALFLGDRIVFLSRHPGRVREIFEPEFKRGERVMRKEALYDRPGYRALERHVMHLMRDEAARA
ncbi:MAG: ABC transporter ATP-binding protein [Gammaproteobacteria bacterium]